MLIISLARARASAAGTVITAGLTLAAAGCAAAVATSAPQAKAPLTCTAQSVPVALSPHVDVRITGQLCARGDPSGRVLEVLVPGATYGASYWNFPYDPARYSYARAATGAGYATLAVNRPGTVRGAGYPPAADLTVPAKAHAIHELITMARRGQLRGGNRFAAIVVGGFSLGSFIALDEAATYGDASGLIVTAATHRFNPPGKAKVAANIHPAAADPQFRGWPLPAGYLTSKPPASTRAADFYAPGTTDPRVVAEDEQLKTTTTRAEITGISAVAADPALSRRIDVPILIAVGQRDGISCGLAAQHLSCATARAVLSRERTFYSGTASLSAYVLPGAGHALNLATDAPQWFSEANGWIARNIRAPH